VPGARLTDVNPVNTVSPQSSRHAGPGPANPRHVHIGENSWIDDYVVILAGPPGGRANIFSKANPHFNRNRGELWIGANTHIAQMVTLQAHGGLSIGGGSGIASGARVYTLSHHYRDLANRGDSTKIFKFSPRAPVDEQALVAAACVMEDFTALGLNSVMLPGATICRGAWVGVLSVVQGEIPPNSVASGNPATVVKMIR